MDYTTRPATAEDYDFCYALTKTNMLELFTRHWGGWDSSKFCDGFKEENIQIIISGGKPLGYYSLVINEDSIFLDNIQISEAARGQGIGKAILAEIIEASGSKDLTLTTFSDNPALNLYKRLGFLITDQSGATVKMKRSGTR
jgi:ribosomal protein S18 acetylase RimI-like enzyme